MAKANKTYGFTIAVQELKETVPNIFRYASAYKRNNNLTSQGLWEMFVEGGTDNLDVDREPEEEKPPVTESDFLPDEVLQSDVGTAKDVDPEAMEGEKYNMCHFWSNFEIARLDFFRGKPYQDFFKMMDKSGGFWMERVSEENFSQRIRHGLITNKPNSGEMLPSTRSLPVPFCHQQISTTLEISATDIQPSSIALPMLPLDNGIASHTSKSRPKTRRNGARKTNTGTRPILQRRTASGVDVDATLISSTSRANRAAAWLNG